MLKCQDWIPKGETPPEEYWDEIIKALDYNAIEVVRLYEEFINNCSPPSDIEKHFKYFLGNVVIYGIDIKDKKIEEIEEELLILYRNTTVMILYNNMLYWK